MRAPCVTSCRSVGRPAKLGPCKQNGQSIDVNKNRGARVQYSATVLAGVRGTDATTVELGGTLSCATKKLPVLDMGKRKFQDYISDECHRRYSCVHCRAHLANHDELISKVCFESYFMYCCGIYIFFSSLIVVPRKPRQGLPLQQSVSIAI